MHLVPPERLSRRILEGDRVCRAIEILDHAGDLQRWAALFATLGDPSRLALLLAIAAAGPISVSDLAVATGLQESTTSHALALLRAGGTVVAKRDGRVVRYRLGDAKVRDLLGYAGLDQMSVTASAARPRD
ncbi:MAG: ArsR/SmtB family transcription factor [Acidimicrobiales bacterium]